MAKMEPLNDIILNWSTDEEMMDGIRTVLTYILVQNTDLDMETIFSLVFTEGEKITWH